MTEEAMAKVLDYIKKRSGVSFVEIERVFDDVGFKWKGGLSLVDPKYRNILFWDGWNQEAVDIVVSLIEDGSIIGINTTILVYLADGKALSLEIAKSYRDYKTLRWLPMVFNAA